MKKFLIIRQHKESTGNYYKAIGFAGRRYMDVNQWPTLKIEYRFPVPKAEIIQGYMVVRNIDDLETVFSSENISYSWLINGERGSVWLGQNETEHDVNLVIEVTNNIGEKYSYTI